MNRRRKIVSWIAGALFALIVVLVGVLATFDWNRMKPFVDDKVSQAIGREFMIHGDLSVHWRRAHSDSWWQRLVPWPEFTAEQVSIGNPAGASKPQFARLDSLQFRLSPLPLLAHRIVVPTLQLVHPTVELERDKQGRSNWDFKLAQSDTPSRWKLDLHDIGFSRGRITLDDKANDIELNVVIEPLQGAIPYDQIVAQESADARKRAAKSAGHAAAKSLKPADHSDNSIGKPDTSTVYLIGWKAKGTYQGQTLKGSGKTGGMLALQDSSVPFPLQADVQAGDSHIALVGTLTDPVHLGALDVQLWFSGSSMSKLYPLTGITLPDTPPYATEGHLKATLGKHGSRFDYQHFSGHVGNSDLAGNLQFITGGERPKLSGDLHSKLLQFSDLGSLIGADNEAGESGQAGATPQPANKLLPVEPFRTERWKAMDADVTFEGEHIVRAGQLPIDSLSTHLVLRNGAIYLDPLRFSLAGGSVASSITLDGNRSPIHGKLQLAARRMQLKKLFPKVELMRSSLGEINGDAELDATGDSVAALLGNANGELKLLMSDGMISKTLLETAGLNVGNIIIGKLFGDKPVEINCAATAIKAQNGVFDLQLFVLDTTDAVINMDGTVNLATEKLDLDVTPHTKGARILSLRSPLYVKGTLKDPDVGVQPGPLLLRGGAALGLAVVAAPVAGLLALISPSHDNEQANTCHAVLEQLRSSGQVVPPTRQVPDKARKQANRK